ncbi:MAG TPA: GNAT family N-acetyltransferase [Roseiflexaceae bacterium]|nr:GNAT family N-acetyltransferase [Roseiflexaceae bacterium]HMP42599.1 GNAT family N-acetyltransferase [Roseiflexaceae bacterium]
MALATWWRSDSVPALSLFPGFRVELSCDTHLIAGITRLAPSEVHQRLHDGHQPYLAFVDQTPVGYGWMATREASIGELDLRFALPVTERYLWDFATLPAWQGYGIYPRLLQHILRQQPSTVERLWIIHAPENSPSGAGIIKAGLLPVGRLSFRSDGGVGLAPFEHLERAQAGAALLGIPLIESILAPCWSCGGATHTYSSSADADSCWPPLRPTTRPCSCAVERKPARNHST